MSEEEDEETYARVHSWIVTLPCKLDPFDAIQAARAALSKDRDLGFLWCPHCAEPILD